MQGITIEKSGILRGIAILLIIACHVIGKFGHFPGTILGAIGVSIFFILSGYGLQESFIRNGRRYFWIKKIKRVWLPYVCLTIPAMIIRGESVGTFWGDITLIYPYYYYGWYLRILLIFYICFYFSTWIKRQNLYNVYWALFIVSIYFFSHDIARINGLAFVGGVLLSRNKNFISSITAKKQYLIMALGVAGALSSFFLIPGSEHLWLIRCQIIQIFLAVAIIIFVNLQSNKYMLLGKVGIISYELYIIHGWFIAPVARLDVSQCLLILPLIFITSYLYNLLFRYVWKIIKLQ